MLKFLHLFIFVLFITFASNCKVKLEWFEGKAILSTGETLSGSISYKPELDIVSVLLKNDTSIKSFSAKKVKHFEYFDESDECIRSFVSLDYLHPTYYRSKIFFEVVLRGKIMLVRRPITLNHFYTIATESINENFGSYIYYACLDNQFINLKAFRKQILPLITQDFKEDIGFFIDNNRLKIRNKESQVVLIDYYNFLSDDKRKKDLKYVFSLINNL